MARLLPDWIDAYLAMTRSQESPEPFHLWTGLWTLAAAVDRNVWYDRFHYRLVPHFYVVLVAGSGRCRKTTAAAIGVNLLRKLAPPVPIFAQKITPEALIGDMAHQAEKSAGARCAAVVFASELSAFMGREERYSGLEALLTDLYDDHPAGWEYRTKTKGKFKLPNPTVHLLGCTTAEWLKEAFSASSIGGGLASRIMFVYQQTTDRSIPFPEDAVAETREIRAKLGADLAHIRALKGEFTLSKDARQWYETWYKQRKEEHRELDGYYSRKPDHALRLGMIFSLAHRDELVIGEVDLRRALDALDDLESLLYVVYGIISETPQAARMRRALQVIRRGGEAGIPRAMFLRKCWRFGGAKEIDDWLSMFKQAQIVEERADGKGKAYAIRDGGAYVAD